MIVEKCAATRMMGENPTLHVQSLAPVSGVVAAKDVGLKKHPLMLLRTALRRTRDGAPGSVAAKQAVPGLTDLVKGRTSAVNGRLGKTMYRDPWTMSTERSFV